MENDVLSLVLNTKGGQISEVRLKNYDCYLNRDTTEVMLWNEETNGYSFTLTSSSQRFVTSDFYFTPVVENDSTVLMKLDLGAGSWWGIRYTLGAGSYLVAMDVVQNGMSGSGIIPANVATMDLTWYQKMRRNEEGRMFEERNSAIYYKLLGDDVEDLSGGFQCQGDGEGADEVDRIQEPVLLVGAHTAH